MENNNLKERLARLSPEQREKLLQKLNLNLKPASEPSGTEVIKAEDTEYPLSNDQQRMWMFEQIQGSGAAYNIVFALHMQGNLELEALEYAFTQLVNQHEILRTHFVEQDDEVRQKVNAPFKVKIDKIDSSHLDFAQNRDQIESLVYDLVDVKIDLDTLPLFRASLIQLSPESNILVFVLHHILADGWSLGLIEQQISQNYIAWLKGQRKDVAANGIQYRHYVSWQESWLKSDAATQQLNYWKKQLADAPAYLPLPTLVDRNKDASLDSSSYMFSLSHEQMAKLKALVVKENVSLFMAMMAAFKVTLGYLAGVEDVVVGSPVANRKQKQFDDVVGMFSNTVALRTKPELNCTFREYLNAVRQTSLSAFSNQNIPFEQVVDAVCTTRSAAYSPLFQVLFALQVREVTDAELSGIEIEAMDLIRREIEFDLIFEFFDNGRENSGVISYKTARYSEKMIQTLESCFTRVLDIVLDNPDSAISEVSDQLAQGQTSPVYQANLAPTEELVAGNSSIEFEGQTINGETLSSKLSALAQGLNKFVVEKNKRPVCLTTHSELEYWLSILATTTLDKKIFIVDENTATDTCLKTIKENDIQILITLKISKLFEDNSALSAVELVEFDRLLDSQNSNQGKLTVNNDCRFLSNSHNSTLITGKTLNHSLSFLQSERPLATTDVVLMNVNLPMELRLISALWPLMAGAKVSLKASVISDDASVVMLNPGEYRHLASMEQSELPKYRHILVNGEVTDTSFDSSVSQELSLIWSFPQTGGPALIKTFDENGKVACAHQGSVESVNALNQTLPKGIGGELRISNAQSTLLTGIKGRVTDNGIEINDKTERCSDENQLVWVNGHLINPILVERKVAEQPGIADIAILPRVDLTGVQSMVAYIVPDRKLSIESLRARLENHLNPFEIPAYFVLVNQIPLNGRGDVDVDALMQTPVLENSGDNHITWLETAQGEIPVSFLVNDTESAETNVTDTRNENANAAFEEELLPDAITSGEPLPQLDMPSTLVEMFNKTLKMEESRHITYILDGDGNTAEQTYPELYEDALRILTGLQQAGLSPKDRVLLQISDNQTMLTGFWACVLGGFVPLALACPERYRSEDNETIKIIDVCDSLEISMVLASANNAEGLQALPELASGQTNIQAIEVLQNLEPAVQSYQPDPQNTALLLLTSGSTGKPKAVMQSHKAIMSRSLSTILTCDFNHNVVSFNWMPLDHVGGLVMFHILDVYLGSHQIHCPTSIILDNPLRWLDWMSEYKVTTTWSPNFAYALINENLASAEGKSFDWDLSHITVMINAGEAVVPKTAKEFVAALHPYGLHENAMKPVWGMSETCSGVTYHLPFAPLSTETDSTFVKVGTPIPGVSIRIADADDNLVKEGTIGSLQITGPTITQGYLNNEQATSASFTQDGWFKTGDLARIENGVVTITGREKDLIIINGQNYQGQEIEKLVERNPEVLPAHVVACGVRTPEDSTDKLALFFSQQPDSTVDYETLKRDIRRAVLNGVGLAPSYFIPFSPEQFPRTSIGKIQRSLLVKQFGEGEFDHLWSENENKVQAWFYEPDWILRRAGHQIDNEDLIIVITGHTEVGVDVAEVLSAHAKGPVIQVQYGDGFREIGSQQFELQPESREQWLQLFSTLQSSLTGDIHIVSFAGCDDLLSEQQLLSDWNSELQCTVSELLAFSQAITQIQENFQSIKLDVVSQRAFAVNEQESQAPEKGLLQGFIKTLPQEIPNLEARQIDVNDLSAASVAAIVNEIQGYATDDVISLRNEKHGGDKRYVARLKPMTLPMVPVKPKPLNTAQFYIVTGGLGGIGARLTESLLQHDKVNVLVLGRSTIDALKEKAATSDNVNLHEKLNAWSQFSQNKETFAYEAVDVCDVQGLKQVIAKYEDIWQKLPGAIFHLAGDSRDVQIAEETLDDMLHSMQAKVTGACAIHTALLDREDVEQIHFGSVNGYFGGYGFSAYSAANSFLNAWCQNLYRQGKPVYCYQWSMWDELGLSRGYQLKRQTQAKGFQILDAEQGLLSLRVAMASPVGSMLIGLDGTNPNIERQITQPYRSLQAIQSEQSSTMPTSSLAGKDIFGTALSYSSDSVGNLMLNDGNRELKETEQRIAAIWKEILKLSSDVKVSDDFFELGGNSLQITRLSSALVEQFEIEIAMHQLFEHSGLAALANYIEQQAPATSTAIAVIPRDGELPLSFAQQRFWFIDQLQGSSVEYNIPMAIRLTGSLDKSAFQKALDEIVNRHEVLRTTYHQVEGGKGAQIIHPATSVAIEHVDLSHTGETEQQKLIEQYTSEEVFKPFNLSEGLMMRAMLIALSEQDHVLLFTMHHIASDGWSLNVLTGEFIALYEAYIQGNSSPLAPVKIQYADYGYWQTEMMQSEPWLQQLAYWRNKLADLPELHNLPLDAPRPVAQNFQADRLIQEIKPELVNKLRHLAKEHDVTLFMLLQSAFSLLLGRWSNSNDIVMGVPVAGRDRGELEGLIGCFINTLVFRTDLSGNDSFVELLKQAKTNALEAFSNQHIPFELLVEELNPNRELAYNPVCQIKFVLQNYEQQELKLTDLEVSPIDNGYDQLHFDLDLTAFEMENGLFFHWGYKQDLFKAQTIARMADSFEALLEHIVVAPETAIYHLNLMPEGNEQQLLSHCHGTVAEHNRDKCIHQVFEDKQTEFAEQTAVAFGDKTLSYRELNTRANRVAHYLQQNNIGSGQFVGIYAERSIELVIAMLGALKSGAAYIPVEPKTTKDRLADIVQDSGMTRVLAHQVFEQNLPVGIESLWLDDALDDHWLADYETQNLDIQIPLDDTAYVIYTSGSTGVPKGVEISHKGLMDYCAYALDDYYPAHLTGAMVVTSHGFDLAIPGFYLPLLSGGTTELLTSGEELPELAEFLGQADSLDYLIRFTPMHVRALLDLLENQQAVDAAHVFVVGGDVFPVELARALQQQFPESQIYNHYGPTETVVGCSIFDVTANLDELQHVVPVGTAMHNTALYVLNKAMEPCPVGVPGELYVGGAGVAKGYLNQAELTADKFITSPFDAHQRLYKTGDVVRYLPDAEGNPGGIEFMGRQDDQVKIRGFRIEPGEIANKLKQFESVKEALVIADGEAENKKLLAWVVPHANSEQVGEELSKELLNQLEQCLPEYLVPSAILTIAEMPLTANGKLDKKALPKPSDESDNSYIEPATDTEQKIAEIWADLLKKGIQDISRTSDFYQLGGQSLLAIRVVANIRNHLEAEVSIADVFDHRVLSDLAKLVDKQKLAASLVYDDSDELADDEMELKI